MKKFIGKSNGNYIIDKKVRRDKKLGTIVCVKYPACEGIKSKGAIKFLEDEKNWLSNHKEKIEWEEISM